MFNENKKKIINNFILPLVNEKFFRSKMSYPKEILKSELMHTFRGIILEEVTEVTDHVIYD